MPTTDHKACRRCGEDKPLTDFVRNGRARDGRHSYCKPCLAEYQAQRPNRAATHRRSKLKRRYGLTEADIEQMRLKQGGKCAVCRAGEPSHVDHCHKTGHVRGLLCNSCNRGLGYLHDDPEIVARAAEYLRTLEESIVS